MKTLLEYPKELIEMREEKESFSKVKDIIVYLTSESEYLTQKRLMKLFYLTEIFAIEMIGKRLTNVKFYNYYYGPFSFDVEFVSEVISGYDILIEEGETKFGYEASFYKAVTKKTPSLTKEEIEVLDEVLKRVKYEKTEIITEFIKESSPYDTSIFFEEIDFDGYKESIDSLYEKEEVKELLEKIKIEAE